MSGVLNEGNYVEVSSFGASGGPQMRCPGCGHWTAGLTPEQLTTTQARSQTEPVQCACYIHQGLPHTMGSPRPIDCACRAVIQLVRSGTEGRYTIGRVYYRQSDIDQGRMQGWAGIGAPTGLRIFDDSEAKPTKFCFCQECGQQTLCSLEGLGWMCSACVTVLHGGVDIRKEPPPKPTKFCTNCNRAILGTEIMFSPDGRKVIGCKHCVTPAPVVELPAPTPPPAFPRCVHCGKEISFEEVVWMDDGVYPLGCLHCQRAPEPILAASEPLDDAKCVSHETPDADQDKASELRWLGMAAQTDPVLDESRDPDEVDITMQDAALRPITPQYVPRFFYTPEGPSVEPEGPTVLPPEARDLAMYPITDLSPDTWVNADDLVIAPGVKADAGEAAEVEHGFQPLTDAETEAMRAYTREHGGFSGEQGETLPPAGILPSEFIMSDGDNPAPAPTEPPTEPPAKTNKRPSRAPRRAASNNNSNSKQTKKQPATSPKPTPKSTRRPASPTRKG